MYNYEVASGAGVKFLTPFENIESDSRITLRTMFDMPLLRPAVAAATASIPGTATLLSPMIESPDTVVCYTC